MTTTETTTETELNWSDKIGSCAYSSIEEMVTSLTADRDRFEELTEWRDNWIAYGDDDDDETTRTEDEWKAEYPEEAEELQEIADEIGECETEEDARDRIMEDPLSLRIFGERTNGEWEATDYELLLTTGGPAVRIVGELGQHNEPVTARLEVQDWFKPWTEYFGTDRDVLLRYASQFCFDC